MWNFQDIRAEVNVTHKIIFHVEPYVGSEERAPRRRVHMLHQAGIVQLSAPNKTVVWRNDVYP